MRRASAVAWARPVSLSGVSTKPWTRSGSRLSLVSPWRARRTPGNPFGPLQPIARRSVTAGETERVRPEPKPQGLQRQHVFGGDIAEVDIGSETAHEPHLLVLARGIE